MPDGPELDQLLDDALRTYAEPNFPLEDRILSAFEASRSSSNSKVLHLHNRRLIWSLALSAAVFLLILVIGIQKTPQPDAGLQSGAHQFQQARVDAHQSEPPSVTQHLPDHPVHGSKLHRNHPTYGALAISASPPKLDIFPSPRPLTPEERTFADYIERAPEPERKAFAQALDFQPQPLRISAINIQPIEPIDDIGN
jgi:hypothetical protein